ncbi:complement C1q-like protein 4 [Mercenaria mercenaria]|uniref:complement C1q-like protein 4 n=1 Tax=Mercenaria mercenaria TaxID=6596 RepID=UPI00234FAFD0|nr:complement C1q-like protein 4 [Mercenaria mercenaria]
MTVFKELICEIIQLNILDADEQRIVRRENEVIVAFYATVGQHHIEHAGANQAIVFDDVITNLGTAYSKYAGDFRAPVSGTYVFSVTLMAYGGHTTHYRIVKNGTGMGNIYLRGQDGAYTSSALTTVLELKQGDSVSVQNIDPDEYLFGYAYNAFSGFLLQQDFSNQAIVGK